ncbi:MAG: dipeptidase [candidate division KSB1 bacterium]|nr:dipeptidase [candidate division KSB1 bacterium]MDZ7275367.1 dipeptidase [candidate division KSB1 bacterium]MDZ7286320.1 dipeptidase [candidate division KSB1 bacterium]MDZ7296547.1 dipeptidase [candidate division KSB1 bacterium]MDZ7308110.1 dipeptidase [candidate division KSB1 bacterium]
MKFKQTVKRGALVCLGLALIGAGLFWGWAPTMVAKNLNRVHAPAAAPPPADVQRLHDSLFVADLHADALLWNRDLLECGSYGHVDIPRLIEGGVALQGFTVVTKTPRHLNIERNDDRSDDITLLAIAQRWPVATWFSLKARALHQARRLHEVAARSRGRFTLILTAPDLEAYLARRAHEKGITAGFLGLEGCHALNGGLASVDELYAAGFRMLGLTHFFDNQVGGSAHGLAKGGLTAFGRRVVQRAEELGMLIDLAHASPQLIEDVLAIARRPLVVSHAGLRGHCDNQRNLSDDHVRRIAATGGLIGIGFWETACCGHDAAAIAAAMRYAVGIAGIDHVALGSDFDGAVSTPFDASGMVQLTAALQQAGFNPAEIRKVMGDNLKELLRHHLPPR